LALACDYYIYSNDKDFLEQYLPKIIKASKWIVGELRATRKLNSDGSRPLYYGLMPFGVGTDLDVGYAVAFTDAAPFVDENSRTLVPLRAIGEAMDLGAEWNEETKTATFTALCEESAENLSEDKDSYLGKVTVDFTVGAETAKTTYSYFKVGTANDGEAVSTVDSEVVMDTAAVIKDGRTYAPVKYLAEAFGYNVAWDAETSTVSIGLEEATVADPTVTEPKVADPKVTDPKVTDPKVTDPKVTDPKVADPTVADPTVADPTVADPTVAAPAVKAPTYSNVPDNDDGFDSYK